MSQNPLATIFEGAAGFGSDPVAPPGGRPPYGPAPSGALPPAYMGQPGAVQEGAATSIPGWVWLAGAALLGGGLYYFSRRSSEEAAAADDDDGSGFSRNAGSVKFMEPYSKNGSDDDDDDDDDEDDEDEDDLDDEDDEDEDEEDEDNFAMNASNEEAAEMTPNSNSALFAGASKRTQAIVARLDSIQKQYGG